MFTRRQEFELITALKGRGEVPLKFAYLGDGAENWNKIARSRSSGSGINTVEGRLLQKKISSFTSVYAGKKKVNVVDIGCGDGVPAFPVIEELRRSGAAVCYVPVDISRELLDGASATVKKKFKGISCHPVQLDFEQGNFSDVIYELKKDGSSNLLLFLGSTLGNHSDKQRVLTNFRDSMTADDYLLIGVELTNLSKVSKILPHYKGPLPENFVYFVPEKIGMNRKNSVYDVSWNTNLNQVEMKMILKKDQVFHIGKEKVNFEKDEGILLAVSGKFTEWTITKLLSDVGFRTELLTSTEDRGYILSLIQPTRYSV